MVSLWLKSRLCCTACLAVSLLCAMPVCGTATGPEPELPDAAQMQRLLAGELVQQDERGDDKVTQARSWVFIRAPAEQVWNIIISCEFAFVFMPGLEHCEVLEDHGHSAVVRQVVDKGWATPEMDYTFAVTRQPHRHMHFHMTTGNLKVLRGSWDFIPYADGTVLHYELGLRPQAPAPGWLVRRNLRQDLPAMLQCIRQLSEALDPRQAMTACPGQPQ